MQRSEDKSSHLLFAQKCSIIININTEIILDMLNVIVFVIKNWDDLELRISDKD